MMIDKVKSLVLDNLEVERKFVFHGSRNMLDEFTGKIIGIYPAIFTILDSNGVLKSFSYSDLLIGNLEIL